MKLLEHELLAYPRFIIYQREDLFRFTIDSMLLSGFVELKESDKLIIDLGTGNAVIPIYLSMKTSALIYGVEIQEETFELGVKSVNKNKLEAKIKLINDDIKNLPQKFKGTTFDCVTCNPPYFKYSNNSNVNDQDSFKVARHEVLITLEEIFDVSYKLLKDKGSFYLIHRPERLADIISYLRNKKIEPKIIRFVHPSKNKNANHVLIKGIKNGNPGSIKVLPPLYIYKEDNNLTEEVLEIYYYGRNEDAFK